MELLQNLLRMAPTEDEELKLRLYSGELAQLGPAERFLKALVDIPFAFKRLEALLFMCTLQEEVATTKESFETLEVGNWKLCFFSALGLILACRCWLSFFNHGLMANLIVTLFLCMGKLPLVELHDFGKACQIMEMYFKKCYCIFLWRATVEYFFLQKTTY